jgi:arsenate reductase (thioredoxin)
MSRHRPEVLFLCVHNAGRSQMAAAMMTDLADDSVVVHTAGSEPADRLNPAVVEALSELGLDISRNVPTMLTSAMAATADVIVTMGCGDACPVYPGKRYLDWELTDPAGLSLAQVRVIRDDIAGRVAVLLAELTAS